MSNEPLKDWAAVITAAAKDHLGLIALALLVICFLTQQAMALYKGKRRLPPIYSVGIVSTIIIVLLVLTYGGPASVKQAAPLQTSPTQDIVVNGSQSTTGEQSQAIGSMSGGTINNTSSSKQH
ncbi:hypothetical protein [Massilia sp. ZL223]|uniref:hypothetical protein n=1 Tax=Massilia sp. ZL223 TaxID=2824904 RepID=UPI001B83062A|nr:hypothetical protein [Massilia sp. ZL223]MBQ5962672.1 hypothetical protein [Massilia sp. ZL223]